MQNRPMAYNFLQCDFLLQPLLHTLHLVILAFLSSEVLVVKVVIRACRKIGQLNFFVLSCFRYPRYQRIIGHLSNCFQIFGLQLRLYGPVLQHFPFLFTAQAIKSIAKSTHYWGLAGFDGCGGDKVKIKLTNPNGQVCETGESGSFHAFVCVCFKGCVCKYYELFEKV